MDRLKSPEAIANHQARQKRNREACNKTDKRKVKKSKNKAARLGTEQEVPTPEEFEAHVAAGHRPTQIYWATGKDSLLDIPLFLEGRCICL